MAKLAFTAAGLGVGTAMGNPLAGLEIGSLMGSWVESNIVKPTDKKSPGPRLEFVDIQTAAYGRVIPKLFGTYKMAGNIIWCSPIYTGQYSQGHSDFVNRDYVTFAVAFCVGPVGSIRRIWFNDRLVVDQGDDQMLGNTCWTVENMVNNDAVFSAYVPHHGEEDQQPDEIIKSFEDGTQYYMNLIDHIAPRLRPVPAYRGLCYCVFHRVAPELWGGDLPVVTAEISAKGSSTETVDFEPIDILRDTVDEVLAGEGYKGGSAAVSCPNITDGDTGTSDIAIGEELYSVQHRANPWWWHIHQHMFNALTPPGFWDDRGDGDYSISAIGASVLMTMTKLYSDPPYQARETWSVEVTGGISSDLRSCSVNVPQPGALPYLYPGTQPDGTVNRPEPDPLMQDGNVDQPLCWDQRNDGVETTIGHGENHLKILLMNYLPCPPESIVPYVATWMLGSRWDTWGAVVRCNSQHGASYGYTFDQKPVSLVFVALAAHEATDTLPALKLPSAWSLEAKVAGVWSKIRLGDVWDADAQEWKKVYAEGTLNPDLSTAMIAVDLADNPLSFCEGVRICSGPNQDIGVQAIYLYYEPGLFSPDKSLTTCYFGVDLGVAKKWNKVRFFCPELGGYGERRIFRRLDVQSQVGDVNKPEEASLVTERAIMLPHAGGYGPPEVPTGWCEYRLTMHQGVTSRFAQVRLRQEHWLNGLECGVSDQSGHYMTCSEMEIVLSTPNSPGDNLVLTAAEDAVIIEDGGVWDRYDLPGKRVSSRASHGEIPCSDCDFDVDEAGNVYTSEDIGGGEGRIVRLDGVAFQKYLEPPSHSVGTPWRVRVFRNEGVPYVAVIGNDRHGLFVFHRVTMEWGPFDYMGVPAPSGFEFAAMDLEVGSSSVWGRGANVWAVLNSTTQRVIFRIMPMYGMFAPVEFAEFDVSDHVAHADVILFDPDTRTLWVGDHAAGKISFFSVSTDGNTVTHLDDLTGDVVPTCSKSAWRRGLKDGRLYYAFDESGVNKVRAISGATRSIVETWDCTDDDRSDFVGGSVYDGRWKSVVSGCKSLTNSYCRVYWSKSSVVDNWTSLADVVKGICSDVGLQGSDVDASSLEDTKVWGYLLNARSRARDNLDPVLAAYFVDAVETDGVLVFRDRASSSDPVAAIDEMWLASHPYGDDRPQELVTVRQQEVELPRTVEVCYPDFTKNYETVVARAGRQNVGALEPLAINVPVAMGPMDARILGSMHLLYVWMQRNRHKCAVPRAFSWLDPSDVFSVVEGGITHTVRLDNLVNRSGVIDLELVDEDVACYSPDVHGSSDEPSPVPTPIPVSSETTLAIVDCPNINQTVDAPGLHVAACGASKSWPGCSVEISRDGGASWQAWGDIPGFGRRGSIGLARTALADTSDPWVVNPSASVLVQLANADGVLAGATDEQLLSGANLAALGDEVFQFGTASALGKGLYSLSRLVRGRSGTEWATSGHSPGDRFVLLDAASVLFHRMELSDLGVPLRFRAVTRGAQAPSSDQSVTPAFVCMKPFAPCGLTGSRDGSNNLTVSWVRRTRFNGDWQDLVDVPMNEAVESYTVRVLGASGEVIRETTASSTSWTYTAANQASDGFTPGDPVEVEVVQISSSCVPGQPARAVV